MAVADILAGTAGGVLALFGMIIAGFMAPSLTALYDVYWTDENVEGPSKLFGPALGAARASISWSAIVKSPARQRPDIGMSRPTTDAGYTGAISIRAIAR